MFVITTFCALTPFFCASSPAWTDRSSSPTINGLGSGTSMPLSRALGKNSRQMYGPTSLVKILAAETV